MTSAALALKSQANPQQLEAILAIDGLFALEEHVRVR
jgi:hypothetical protein